MEIHIRLEAQQSVIKGCPGALVPKEKVRNVVSRQTICWSVVQFAGYKGNRGWDIFGKT